MSRTKLATAVVGLLLGAAPAAAQLPGARLTSIFPAGARQGAAVECSISGTDLAGATGLYFSHPGIHAVPAGPNKFTVRVDADVPVGAYDVRAVTPRGLSNFRAFAVGDWPEALEQEPNDEPTRAQPLSLPVVVNGRVGKPTDVDCYTFHLDRGQRVFVDCWAWRLDSPLDGTLLLLGPDGREVAYAGDYYGKDPFLDYTAPAGGTYVLKVWDFVYGGGPDYFYRLHVGSVPHLDAVVPAALRPGTRTIVTLLGRNLPGGRPAPGGARVEGRALEVLTREVDVPADAGGGPRLRLGEAVRPPRSWLDGMAYRLSTPTGSSNPVFLALADGPVVPEREPNNDRATAQALAVPCEVSGTFDAPGDVDWYSFRARKGERLVIEVFGERQSGLPDPFLVVRDAAGRRLLAADDDGRNVGQIRFTTTTRDARADFTAPADGTYLVQVRDLYYQQRGDARFVYRLSLRRPRPGFRLVAVPPHDTQPDATAVGRGGRYWIDVLVLREDGFDGPVRVEAADLPPGVTAGPVVVGPGKTSAPLVLTAAADAPPGHGEIRVTGRAEVGGREVVHEARGGGLTWPTVNTPGVARLADSIPVAVRGAPPFVLTATPGSVRGVPGARVRLGMRLERAADWTEPVQLSGLDLPPGASLQLVALPRGATEAQVELALPANLRPGTYTFAVAGAGQVPRDYLAVRDPHRPRGANVRAVYPSNPVTLIVEPPRAAPKLSPGPGGPTGR
jgi:hypothetical protein